jgi:hypothetical protein
MGTDLNNRIARTPPAPVSRSQIIGLTAGRLKDASGGRALPGTLPPGPCHGTVRLPGNSRRQSRIPRQAARTPRNTLDTAPLLQG